MIKRGDERAKEYFIKCARAPDIPQTEDPVDYAVLIVLSDKRFL